MKNIYQYATVQRTMRTIFDNSLCDGAEIILRSQGLCNLSEVVCRPTDTVEQLQRKVAVASTLGTLQSTLTNFRFLRPNWSKNAREERLLGVSLTGIQDHPALSGKAKGSLRGQATEEILGRLRLTAVDTNHRVSQELGINPSVAITTIKPSGTVSQLVNSASGIHPRYAPYYIRTVRADKKDPLAQFLRSQGVPVEDDVTKPHAVDVFSFPICSPKEAVFRNDMSALEQLEHYLIFKKHWCEHSPSITVYVKEDEWLKVGAWVYEHFDEITGLSFLPHSDHAYKQAPYQEITEEQYLELVEKFPKINWEEFKEVEDTTTGTQELACVSGVCEI